MAEPKPISGLPHGVTFTDTDLIAYVPYGTGATSYMTVKEFKDSFVGYTKIASKAGINAVTVGSTVLDFEYNITLANCVPLVAIYKRDSGTLTGQFAKIKDSTSDLTTASDLSGLAATSKRYIQLVNTGSLVVTGGSLSVQTTVGSSVPGTFSVIVYGLRTP